MSWVRFGRAAIVTAFTLAASAGLVVAGQPGSTAQASGGRSGAGGCIAHHPGRCPVPDLVRGRVAHCGGPAGPGSAYCDTPLSPAP